MRRAPSPSGPSPHFHRSITESFYVLSGTVRLHDGRRWVDGGSGDFFLRHDTFWVCLSGRG